MDAWSKVVVALDYEEEIQAYRLVETLGPRISRYKVGPQLFSRCGSEIVKFLHSCGKKVFLDLKLHDTPLVVARTVELFATLGVEFATVHCLGGRTMLEMAGCACRGSTLRLLGVTLLTRQGAEDSFDWGLPDTKEEMVLRLAGLGMESRLSGVICSPYELSLLRPKTVPGFLLVTPGLRLEGKEVFQDELKQIATPTEALAWGADLLILGRSLTQSRDPLQTLETLFS